MRNSPVRGRFNLLVSRENGNAWFLQMRKAGARSAPLLRVRYLAESFFEAASAIYVST